jgi:hypothetical protein
MLILIFVFVIIIVTDVQSKVPPKIEWVNMPVRAMPVVMNFIGATNLVGPQREAETQFVGIGPITLSPMNGNMQNSTIRFNGTVITPDIVSWTPCEGTRRTHDEADLVIRNSIRMPFSKRVILQKWELSSRTNITFELDGPMFRLCYPPSLNISGSCGWDTRMPIDLSTSYIRDIIDNNVGVLVDNITNATSVITFWTDCEDRNIPPIKFAMSLSKQYAFDVEAHVDETCSLYSGIAAGFDLNEARSLLEHEIQNKNSFEQSCEDWNMHYESAFQSDSATFSGNLPVLESSSSPELVDLYDWAATAMISLERIGYKSFERVFVISEGPSNSYDGDKDMGGAGQFTWGTSLSSLSLSLLIFLTHKNTHTSRSFLCNT